MPPFKRNQFGATVGGPIRATRTFFFFNYEGLRQDLSSTTITTVPSAAARTGQLVNGKVTIDPKVAPYLRIFPLPNGVVSGDTGVYSFVSAAVTTLNFETGRVDHIFSDRDSIHGSFLVSNSRTSSPDATDFVITGQISQSRFASVEETHVFHPNFLNIIRAGMNRDISEAPVQAGIVNPLASDTSLGFLPNTPVGGITITGLTPVGGGVGALGENNFHFTSWQLYDDLFYIHGPHSLEFGIAFERIDFNEVGNANPDGVFSFGSLQAFLTDQPQSFKSTIPGKSPTIYLRQSIPAFYIRDDYRVLPNLTLNLGLRYEMATVPTEKYGRLSNLDALTATVNRSATWAAWDEELLALELQELNEADFDLSRLFRLTCYYYRGAYHKLFWADPPACRRQPAVRLPGALAEETRTPPGLKPQEADSISYLAGVARGKFKPEGLSSLANNISSLRSWTPRVNRRGRGGRLRWGGECRFAFLLDKRHLGRHNKALRDAWQFGNAGVRYVHHSELESGGPDRSNGWAVLQWMRPGPSTCDDLSLRQSANRLEFERDAVDLRHG